eukprot:CAMPEP_0117490914 /NCGR_PEP_ID=MMETSP0784-20121206/17793_1 /TAXON_ID=39447 /ORGANISM="" /LENGTH=276 /DNA_ID=CAMNT_0005285681 /DNA_START=88 /DNA_END=918 /DNA_ORIENTATION=-
MSMKASLVDQVKNLQRTDNDAKEAWWAYCDSSLGGVRDPNRHDEDVLRRFLSSFGPAGGLAPPAAKPANRGRSAVGQGLMGGGGGGAYSERGAYTVFGAPELHSGAKGGFGMPTNGGNGGSLDLSSFIKTGQRLSPHWKEAWQAYCHSQGSSALDPSRHDEVFITTFIDYVGQCVQAQLGDVPEDHRAAMATPMSRKRPSDTRDGGRAAPAAKRVTHSDGDDFGKAALVERVKAFQRRGGEFKQMWWTYTDNEHGGIHDPARHEASVLENFLAQHE